MNKQWKKMILTWTVLLILISSIPVFMGFLNQNEQWRFSGFVMNIDDGNSYITKMMQGYQGAWLYKAPYSLEPQNGLLVFFPYILLGKLGYPPALHTQMIVIFHMFRVFGIVVMTYGINRFIKLFHLKIEYRLLVLILSTAGGGTGWLIMLWGQSKLAGWVPLEFISPEGFGFISAYTIPHLALARGLLFGSIAFFLEGIEKWQENGNIPAKWIYCAAGVFVIGFLQPIYCAIAGLWMVIIVVLFSINRGKFLKLSKWELIQVLLVLIPAILWVGYMLTTNLTDPYLKEWNKQSIVNSPPLVVFLLSYGVYFLYILINYRNMRVATTSLAGKFSISALVIASFLVYFPVNFQRRLVEGLWIFLLIFIAILIQNQKSFMRRFSTSLLILFSIPSTIILVIMGIQAAKEPASPVFVSAHAVDVYKKAGELGIHGNFLTPFRIGNEITAWAPIKVSLGQGPETINYKKFNDMYQDYVNGQTDPTTRSAWSNQYDIKYAIVERSQIDNLNNVRSYGNEVYSSGNLIITEIVP